MAAGRIYPSTNQKTSLVSLFLSFLSLINCTYKNANASHPLTKYEATPKTKEKSDIMEGDTNTDRKRKAGDYEVLAPLSQQRRTMQCDLCDVIETEADGVDWEYVVESYTHFGDGRTACETCIETYLTELFIKRENQKRKITKRRREELLEKKLMKE